MEQPTQMDEYTALEGTDIPYIPVVLPKEAYYCAGGEPFLYGLPIPDDPTDAYPAIADGIWDGHRAVFNCRHLWYPDCLFQVQVTQGPLRELLVRDIPIPQNIGLREPFDLNVLSHSFVYGTLRTVIQSAFEGRIAAYDPIHVALKL